MKKVIISSDSLKTALQKLSHAINVKAPLPILANIYCVVADGRMKMMATNTELSIEYELLVDAEEPFDFLLPFDFIHKIVSITRHMPISIEAGKKLKITCGEDVYEVKVAEKIEDLPKWPELPKKKSAVIDAAVISALSTALATVSNNDNKPALQKVLLEFLSGKVTVASTDGSYAVFSQEFDGSGFEEEEELLIGPKEIKVLQGELNVSVSFTQKLIGFKAPSTTIIVTRPQAAFPKFRQIFPDNWPVNLKVKKELLLEALEKCSLCQSQFKAADIDLSKKGKIKFTAKDHQVKVNVEVAGDYEGSVESTAINSERFLKVLGQIEQDEVGLAIHDGRRAIIITSENKPGYRGLIMPIAVDKP